MPVIIDLGNKNLKREHWAKIFAGMQKPFAPDTSYTLDGLRAWKIFDYKQLVEEQSGIATGEANLQGTIDKIKETWDEIEIETKPHRDSKDTYIIGGVEEVLQLLEDNQVLATAPLIPSPGALEEPSNECIVTHRGVWHCYAKGHQGHPRTHTPNARAHRLGGAEAARGPQEGGSRRQQNLGRQGQPRGKGGGHDRQESNETAEGTLPPPPTHTRRSAEQALARCGAHGGAAWPRGYGMLITPSPTQRLWPRRGDGGRRAPAAHLFRAASAAESALAPAANP